MMSTRSKSRRGTTHIVWNRDCGAFQCRECKAILHYEFGFKDCPYCGRRVVHTDERGVDCGVSVQGWR